MEEYHAARAFGALAQESRLRLIRILIARGASGMAAGDISAALAMPASTLSFHLAALELAGLVQSTRQGRQIIYAVRFIGLRQLLGFLTQTCCAGRPELCGDLSKLFAEEAERETCMTPAFNVLFLCTHNSARSMIAEAILERIGKGSFNAYSAGSSPGPRPMPEVMERLEVLGHDVSKLRCKSWDEFMGPDAPRMDFVITLCDTLSGQICPDFGSRPVTAAWPFPDPAKFTGSKVEKATMINELYGMIRRRLEIFINLPFSSLDQMALKKRLDELGDSNKISI